MKIKLALALLTITQISSVNSGETIDSKIKSLMKTHGLTKADLGIHIYSVNQKKTVFSMNADEKLILASNTKIFTASAALALLDETFQTILAISGQIDGKILKGDLVVIAGGDPNISGRFNDNDPTFLFKEWAKMIKDKGIEKINGNIKLYDYIFDREYTYKDWQRYDFTQWYTAPVSAFALNDNCLDFKVTPTSAGDKCKIETTPKTNFIKIINNTTTVKSKPKKAITVSRKNGTMTISGEVSSDSGESFSVPVEEPQLFFGNVFKETLISQGIKISREIELINKEPNGEFEKISIFESKLSTTITVCMTRSQNFYAEMLLKLMGRKKYGKGTRENGIKAVNDYLKQKKLDTFDQADGSGLSRNNKSCAKEIVELLVLMKDKEIFTDSLPKSGEDGSLKKRMKEIKGKVAAKSGHLKGVNTLSGYLDTKYGDRIIFSILVNGGGGDPFQDDVLEYLYSCRID